MAGWNPCPRMQRRNKGRACLVLTQKAPLAKDPAPEADAAWAAAWAEVAAEAAAWDAAWAADAAEGAAGEAAGNPRRTDLKTHADIFCSE